LLKLLYEKRWRKKELPQVQRKPYWLLMQWKSLNQNKAFVI